MDASQEISSQALQPEGGPVDIHERIRQLNAEITAAAAKQDGLSEDHPDWNFVSDEIDRLGGAAREPAVPDRIRLAAGVIDAGELLRGIPPAIPCTATATSSHMGSYPNNPRSVKKWIGVPQMVRDTLGPLNLGCIPVACHAGPAPAVTRTESQVNDVAQDYIHKPVNAVLRQLGVKLEIEKGPEQMVYGAKPDFIARVQSRKRSPGEGKCPSVTADHLDIPKAYNDGVRVIRQCIVPQVFHYTFTHGCKYGWLIDYDHMWAVYVNDEGNIFFSDAFSREAVDPSMREVMLCLMLKVAEEPPQPLQREGRSIPVTVTDSNDQYAVKYKTTSGDRQPRNSKQQGGEVQAQGPEDLPLQAFGGLAVIGHGECGPVRSGRLDGQEVAIKFADAMNERDLVKLLQHEAEMYNALSDLQGAAIPRLVAHGHTAGGLVAFIATELISGQHPHRGALISLDQRKAAEQALASIHQAGFVHGDIRAENIMLMEGSDKVLLLDLGWTRACTSGEEQQRESDQLAAIFGTNGASSTASTICYSDPNSSEQA